MSHLDSELASQLTAQTQAWLALQSGQPAPVGVWPMVFRAEAPETLPAASVPVQMMPAEWNAKTRAELEEQRVLVLRTGRRARSAQLRATPVGSGPTPDSVGLVAELLANEAWPVQKRIRESIQQEVQKSLVLAATAEVSLFGRPLVPSAQGSEVDEQEQAMRKQRLFLSAVTLNARQFQRRRDSQLSERRQLTQRLQRDWGRAERRKQQETVDAERNRLRMLREGDEEGYLALLQEKKNDRLEMLLQQTADFMNKISEMVQVEKDRAQALEQKELSLAVSRETAAPAAEPKQAADLSLSQAAADVKTAVNYSDTRKTYYNTAHTVQEDIVVQPAMLQFGQLREYQLKGLQWLVSLYNNNLNGILADEMGLGKTIQTISLLAYLMEKKKNMGPFLVIVPLSTVSNWKDEFDRWTPGIDVVVYQGGPARRQELWNTKLANNKFHVVLTTFDFVMRDKAKLSKPRWNFLIIDEGHRIKNSESKLAVILSKSYRPKHRLLLTGTPLQNSLPELWSLLNFLLPNIFNSVDSFENWFNAPFETTGEKVEMTEEESLLIIRRLHSVLRPFLLRRLKKEVEKQLPDKIEQVIRCHQSIWQKMLYERMLSDRTLLTEGGTRGLQNKLMQLRKICNHPYLFDERAGYDIDNLMVRAAGKFALLDSILPKLMATGHRVLMFSQMTSLMDILGYYFQLRGHKFLRLDGGTKQEERRERMAQWNEAESEYFIFILSTRAGGLGLNLQTADTVILFDSDWNPQADLQAMDRAHRIGQKKRVLVLRLVTAHSIEERILETATRKLDMDQKVIGAGNFNNSNEPRDRRKILEQLLLKAGDDENKEDEAEPLGPKEINKRLARTEEEYELFKQMDKTLVEQGVPLMNMVAAEELPTWLTHPETVQPKDDANPEGFGRGKRRKNAVDYNDNLDEEEFCMLMDKGADEDEIKEYIQQRDERLRLESAAAVLGAFEAPHTLEALNQAEAEAMPIDTSAAHDADFAPEPVGKRVKL